MDLGADITLGDLKAFYSRNSQKLWLLVVLGTVSVIAVGCLVLPEIFWDKFMYRYYWGPVEVDAREAGSVTQSDGYVITQGYTLISEITYGIILILALYGIFRLFERLKIQIDTKFVLSILPFFFLGGTLRSLEDAELYNEPYVFFAISPVIYFVIGALILGTLLYFTFLERNEKYPLRKKVILACLPWAVFDAVYVLIYMFHTEGFNYIISPVVPVILSIVTIFLLIFNLRKTKDFDSNTCLFLFGLFIVTFSIFAISLWPRIEEWTQIYLEVHERSGVTTHALGGILIVIVSIAFTFFSYSGARILKKKYPTAKIYMNPVNLLIIFGQMLDATATFVGIDMYNYSEKHPIPDFFFTTFGTSAVFLPIKLVLALLIIYIIDVSFKEELKNYPILVGIIKVVVIVLGLGPGTRDCLRLVMGV